MFGPKKDKYDVEGWINTGITCGFIELFSVPITILIIYLLISGDY